MAVEKKSPAKKTVKKGLTIPVLDMTGKEVSTVDLPEALFAVKAADTLLSQYLRVYLHNQKNAYGSAKTRSEVTGSTRKIYKQKGTGRARHGANKAPIFVGGGVAHGPKGMKRALSLNKKQITKALLFSLSKQVINKSVISVASENLFTGKTGPVATFVRTVSPQGRMLFIYGREDGSDMVKRSVSNVEKTAYTMVDGLNAYEVMIATKVLFTKNGLAEFISKRTPKTS